MLTARELKSLLAAHGLRLSKRLGQHYLVDRRVIERVVQACGLTRRDVVVEIGAGLGALTEPLAAAAGRVIAVEFDPKIFALLARRMAGRANVEPVCQDILSFAWPQVPGAVAIGAIPYEITSPILVALAEARTAIPRAILIIQREVADRLLAAPGTRAYGRLSVLTRYCWEVRRVLNIPRGAFVPPPAVESACVRLDARATPPVAVDEARFFELVKAAFAQRRKTLVNCLLAHRAFGLSRSQAEAAVLAVGLPATVRGEICTLEHFAALTTALVGAAR